ncbi:MAG: hypothetical protein QG577_80 [Thermodesulfobacteriota bacterium]|nr:hypothetical protein [Thermodesulfobacteriota bacterium]
MEWFARRAQGYYMVSQSHELWSEIRAVGKKGASVPLTGHMIPGLRIIRELWINLVSYSRSVRFILARQMIFHHYIYRLNVLMITVPPLRDRIEDIPELLKAILSRLVKDLQLTSLPAVPPDTVIALSRYHWPGNVRELRNVIERALILSDGKALNLVLPSADASDDAWSHVSTFPEHARFMMLPMR